MASESFDAEAFLAAAGETDPEQSNPESTTDDDEEEEQSESTESAEATEDTEGDTPEATEEAEFDPEAEYQKALAEGIKPKAAKRIKQLLSKNYETEQRERAALAKVQEKEAAIAELQSKLTQDNDKPVPVQVANDPLAAVTTEEQLQATEANAQAWRRWCLRNLNGGTPPVENAEDMTAEEVADALERAEDTLNAVPKRRTFLQEFQAKRSEVRQAMPKMFTPGTEENKAHASYQKQLLNFRTAADQDDIIRKLVEYDRMKAEEKAGIARYPRVPLNKEAAPAAATAKPKPATAPAPAPALRASGNSPAKEAWARLNQPGGSVDVEELMMAE